MKHQIDGFLTWEQWSWEPAGKVSFQTWKPEADSKYCFLIREHQIEVEAPDSIDVRPLQVAALQAEKQKVRAEFAKAVKDLDDQIASLLALEMAK